MRYPRALAYGLVIALLASCAGSKPYVDESTTKNVSIRTAATSVRATVDIYYVDAEGRRTYAGTVKLDKPAVKIGIPPDRSTDLVFEFASSSFWRGKSGVMSHELPFAPQAGRRYEIEVTYRDDIYNVVLTER